MWEFLTTYEECVEGICAICAMFEEVLLRLSELLSTFILAESVASACDASYLNSQDEVVIVLPVEERHQPVAPHVGAFANVMFCVSVIMLLVWDVCLQNERWVSWVFYSSLGEVIAHFGWFVQEFHLFGVVFLPPNPLEEVFGRPFVSRMAVRMTLPCAPMDMKIGVGEGDLRWR